MNTVERIVACYFQRVRRCWTVSDVKVQGGNNRQFDLLAVSLPNGPKYHVESGVTHEENWCPTYEQLETLFRQKYFGVPRPKGGKNTDHEKKKTYLPSIKQAYALYDFDFLEGARVWCSWSLKDGVTSVAAERLKRIAQEYGITEPVCEVL